MADTNHIPDRTLNLTEEEVQIIGYFAQGQKHSISSQNLKLEYTDTSIRLSDRDGKLLGISKQVSQWQRKVLISNNSVYRPSVVEALTALGFIAKQKSSHPEFTEHHYYQVPDAYKLNYTETIELWKVWWNNKRYQLNLPKPPIDVLTFTKGNWYLVRDLQPKQGNFIIRTERGEIVTEPDEYVVWIEAISDKQADESKSLHSAPSFSSVPPQTSSSISVPLDSNLLSGRNTPTEVTSSAQLEVPHAKLTANIERVSTQLEDIDLESYLNTFNTEDAEDVDRIEGIYNIGELLSGSNLIIEDVLPLASSPKSTNSPPQVEVLAEPEEIISTPVEPSANLEPAVLSPTPVLPPLLSISQRQAALKRKAMDVLMGYLQEGDRVTHTEVLTNAQGQELNRKVTKIQRGCPSWAIDQIKHLNSVDSLH
jgi:hypothetical protein